MKLIVIMIVPNRKLLALGYSLERDAIKSSMEVSFCFDRR